MKKFVKVPMERYIELEQAENDLYALERVGLNNWSGCDEAEFTEFKESDIILPIIEEE